MSTAVMDADSSQSSQDTRANTHPRRPPPGRSVSLRHQSYSNPRARSHEPVPAPSSIDHLARPMSSPSSLKPLIGKDDSGESSNADKWFDKSNNHASKDAPSFDEDNSPPFFLQHSSSEETPPETLALREAIRNGAVSASGPMRAGLMRFGTDNSSTDDYRGVIDDLTIENKKLKRKLKSYQKVQDPHLKDQKLFEVRVHGLPTQKKKELEDMLREFAMGLPSGYVNESSAAFSKVGPPYPSTFKTAISGASSGSNPFNDSAYASASASGQGSSNRSSSETKKKHHHYSSAMKSSRHHNIQSYLHDIPAGLLPRQPTAMTEKKKKKIVVRRLEQIFAGKGAVTGNEQPLQQEEVSQLAARADRQLYEDNGQKAPAEGKREARIMSEDAPIAAKDFANPTNDTNNASLRPATLSRKRSSGSSNEHRPTRPLDLDPYRAQVPADNFKYMQHLGFSPPGAAMMTPPDDGHGWIYLNLLTNMAQLHTINVTPDFVRRAVQEHSQKFELSADGRKIRWKGGRSVTRTSSDGDDTPSAADGSSNVPLSERGSPRKRIKLMQAHASSSGTAASISGKGIDNKFAWTPLFHHRSNDDDSDTSASDDDEEEDTNESPYPFQQAGDSSGMTSSGVKTSIRQKHTKRENGPIIFYNNAKFCTDLSGDAKAEEARVYNAFLYHNIAQQPVGTTQASAKSIDNFDPKGPLIEASELPEPMDLDDNPIPAEEELAFPDQSPLSSQTPKHARAILFDVSGLGGVYPADNFTINVQSAHARQDDHAAPATEGHEMPSRYPAAISKVLHSHQVQTGRKARMAFHKQVIHTNHQDHPPSQLPDASCFMPAGDSTPEEDEEEDDDMADNISLSPTSPFAPAPSAAPQPIDADYESMESSDEDDDGFDDAVSDGSLDLLAAARQLDPEAIRAREREYDAQLAERLAEEIPAGSSAATAGGGSGWTSPASGVDRAEWESAKKAARVARREEKKESLKRQRGGM